MRTRKTAVAATLIASVLGACTTSERASVAPQPQGVDGRWNALGGPVAYSATFNNGRFASVEQGTGGVLATGTYSQLGPGQINILYTSRTTNQQQSANCNLVQTNRLACAASSGTRFEFTRA
ncbi:hypothetical protein [Aurantimonas sp. 22II-16-19i]|uniref:hypothetical protein n=1 Tax=Aurantimonas sp. 22II-16-19i TaxID=1317114 RepID=UPI0009F7B0B5|nr:hypothetical protein [Aurantimonas sp. 22II-16-19i]ORE98502.1 outer membrane lipoprotein [Aurantimonas sp. 22II-16-19i]